MFSKLISEQHRALFKGCSGDTVSLFDCDEKDSKSEIEDKKVIMLRAGLSKEDLDEDVTICSKHKKDFTKSFSKKMDHRKCSNCDHSVNLFAKIDDHFFDIGYDMSHNALDYCGIKIPYGGKLCKNCYYQVNRLIKANTPKDTPSEPSKVLVHDEAVPKTPDAKRHKIETQDDGDALHFGESIESESEDVPKVVSDLLPKYQDSPDLFDSSFSQSQSSASEWEQSQPKKQRSAQARALDEFRKASNLPGFDDNLVKDFDTVHPTRQKELTNVMVSSVCAVVKGITDDPENQLKLYKSMVDSRKVEESLIPDRAVIPDEVLEVMKSYNNSPTWEARRLILGLLVRKYSFAFLKRFNGKLSDTQNVAAQQDDSTISWMPHLQSHQYTKAKKHYYERGHAYAPTFRQVRKKERIRPEIVEAVVYFVISSENTQQVASGTRKMKDAKGNVRDIAKVIRTQTDEDLFRKITAMLKEKGFQNIPCRRAILNILSCMPASTAKEMCGINATVEEASEALKTLERLIKDLEVPSVQKNHYPKESFDSMLKSLKSASKYYKQHYVYNLQSHSRVASHCLAHGLSDPSQGEFQETCPEEHDERCENCEIIPNLVQCLEGVLKTLDDAGDLPMHMTFDEAQYELHDSHYKIVSLVGHLMRNQVSNSQWEKMLYEKKPHRVMLTVDFAMKLLAKKYRESTKFWYGKVSS